jgi:hypothetical protein
LENMPKLSYSDAWVATSGGIYYTDSRTKPVTVNVYDFTTRTKHSLMTLKQSPVPAWFGLTVSPDRHWLLYSQLENEQSEIMLGPVP